MKSAKSLNIYIFGIYFNLKIWDFPPKIRLKPRGGFNEANTVSPMQMGHLYIMSWYAYATSQNNSISTDNSFQWHNMICIKNYSKLSDMSRK